MMDEWSKLAREFGFPAAVAFFVLWRLDASLKEVARGVEALRRAILSLPARERQRPPPRKGRS